MNPSRAEASPRGATAIVVQARMGSTRLPGKVLMKVAGRPLLSYLLERLARSRVGRVAVATTTEPKDEPIARHCRDARVACVRGPESDVLRRYAMAAREMDVDTVVRVTADCPLLDPAVVDAVVTLFESSAPTPDFASNMLEPGWPLGMAVEVASRAALEAADREARDPAEREHVMPFIWRRPDRFRLASLPSQADLRSHRWTVDTPEDFELVSRILSALDPRNPCFTMEDVLALVEANPAWQSINRHVRQKTLGVREER